MTRLRAILAKGLDATASSWPAIRGAFGWIRRFAAVLANARGLNAAGVRRRFRGLIASLTRRRKTHGGLAEAFDHFGEVTRSDWPGPFRCYDVESLPRTSDHLEHFFGSYRYHEVDAAARWPVRGRWCGGRCAWWRPPRLDSARSTRPT